MLSEFLVFYLLFAACWVLGAFVRGQRLQEAERRRLAAVAATAAERARIARELHDVVTHHVTGMVVQADAAQFLVSAPDRVGHGTAAISDTGRRALAELRHLLGRAGGDRRLRDRGRTPTLGTSATWSSRPERRASRSSSPSTASGRASPSACELAAYRVVQEALTNADQVRRRASPTTVHGRPPRRPARDRGDAPTAPPTARSLPVRADAAWPGCATG